MRLSLLQPFACASAPLVLAACLVGCGTTEIICDPACPAGFRCEESGCVAESPAGPPDLSVGPDLAMGCAVKCSGATPVCGPKGQCVVCLVDGDCPAGQICKTSGSTNLCVSGCSDDARCGGGTMKCCNGQCTDAATDAANCGMCGSACRSNNARAMCVGGVCQAGLCAAGWGDCNMDGSDGCETSLRTDPDHCASCVNKCTFANAYAGCADTCYIRACKFGFDDCNGDEKDGCETSVLSDARNCGACGNVCNTPPHARSACSNGACIVTQCDLGWFDCDRNPANGCEVNYLTDARNCGACGNVCAQGLVCQNAGCTCQQCNFPGAKSKCVNLQCVFDGCLPGYTDCNNNPADGCEAMTASDAKNCGGCGIACPQGESCDLGVCKKIACVRMDWKTGNQNWDCPPGMRLPNVNEFNYVQQCITQQDQAMFTQMNDIAVSVGGCNCKWNNNWCGQPSIESMRQGRMCGDFKQLHICVSQ